MKLHEITLRDGTILHGYISHINHYEERFRVLNQHTLGMIGDERAGKEYCFDDVRSVYALNRGSDGYQVRESNEQLSAWRQWAQANLSKIKVEGS